jgi:hypothetical protein
MQVLPPLIPALVFAVLFFGVYAALGRRFLILVRLAPAGLHPVETLLLQITVGIGVIPVLPLALGLFGALSPASVRIGILVLVLLLVPDLWRVACDLRDLVCRLRARAFPGLVQVWAGLLAVLLATFLVHALFLGFADDDGYHLAAPWRWLREGTLSYLPSYTTTNSGMAFEMSYVVALVFDPVRGAKLLHYATGVTLLVAVMACARRLGSWAVGAAAVSMLLIGTPLVQMQYMFPKAYSDFPVSLSVMVAVLLWMAWRETRDQKLLWCMALCAGFTASFKFTALAALVAWALLIALELRVQGRKLVPGILDLFRFGLIAVLPTLPWFVRNWYLTGNPVYPMAASVFPTRDWSAEQGAVFSSYMKLYSWGVASGTAMPESTRKLLILAAIAGVLAGSAFIYWLVKDRRLRMLLGFSLAYVLICIVLTGLVFRYWMPGVICMLLVACAGAAQLLSSRLRSKSWGYMPAIALMLVAIGVQARHEMREGVMLRDLRVATGITTQEIETANDPAEQMWRYIRQNTPADARILAGAFYSTFGASSFGCFRAERYCVTTDSHLQTYIELTDWTAFLRSVQRAGIQYVVVADQQFSPDRQGFRYRAADNEYPFCVRLAQSAGTLVFQAGHFQLYRLGSLDAAASAP